MNANELMLNDWIYHIDEKESGQVYGLQEDFIGVDVELPKEERAVCWIDGKPEDFEGILLTNDMLVLNGFSRSENTNLFQMTGFPFRVSKWPSVYDISVDKGGTIMAIKYVHEFQQLLRLCGFNEQADNFKIE